MYSMPETDPIVRITISLPQSKVDKIDRIGAAVMRSRSNAIAQLINQAVEPKDAK